METKAMFDKSFTKINEQGVLGMFGKNVSKKIVQTLKQINGNADVAQVGIAPTGLNKNGCVDLMTKSLSGPMKMQFEI